MSVGRIVTTAVPFLERRPMQSPTEYITATDRVFDPDTGVLRFVAGDRIPVDVAEALGLTGEPETVEVEEAPVLTERVFDEAGILVGAPGDPVPTAEDESAEEEEAKEDEDSDPSDSEEGGEGPPDSDAGDTADKPKRSRKPAEDRAAKPGEDR